MPYLLPQSFSDARSLILILAFGDLSRLEACTVLSNEMLEEKRVCTRLSFVKLLLRSKKVEKLAGIHKLAVPHNTPFSGDAEAFRAEIRRALEASREKPNFCVSLYCSNSKDPDEYATIVSDLLQIVREAGFRKANLLRPHSGTDFLAKDVLARDAIDIVVHPAGEGYVSGTTIFIPDFETMRSRATSRPVRSPEISLSPRLARLLINLASLSKGSSLLDPFCGAGTILTEAVLQGVNCIGIDKNPSRISGAKMNLDWISKEYDPLRLGSCSLEVGDVEKLGIILKGKSVDAVVTEPILLPRFTSMPSIHKAKRVVSKASKLYSASLYSISEVVKKGGRVVLVVPSVKTYEGKEVSITLEGFEEVGLKEFQPRRDMTFAYPVRLAFESTRWVKRLVYVFERT
ncbi:MAG: methyltransferase domain-containing protein [Thaumarchaeota archaeon]|nr:methyltransferase domain-containing protein [Nitrososphaerota archaeon]